MKRSEPLVRIVYTMADGSRQTEQEHGGATVQAAPAVLCPYCGQSQASRRVCSACGGLLDPLSMQATQNEMGPWFIRDPDHPFRPGCSHQTLRKLASRGRLAPETVIRGPSTRQFWSLARNVRGVANLLGECHNCHAEAGADDYMCRSCNASFEVSRDRQHFGAGPVRLLPGQAPPEVVARSTESDVAPVGVPFAHSGSSAASAGSAMREGSASALRVLRRELARSKRFITFSVALNVVLLAALLIALAQRAVGPPAPVSQPAVEPDAAEQETATPAATDTSPGLIEVQIEDLQRARALAESDSVDDLQEASRLIQDLKRTAGAAASPEIDELEAAVERALDELAMRRFLPDD